MTILTSLWTGDPEVCKGWLIICTFSLVVFGKSRNYNIARENKKQISLCILYQAHSFSLSWSGYFIFFSEKELNNIKYSTLKRCGFSMCKHDYMGLILRKIMFDWWWFKPVLNDHRQSFIKFFFLFCFYLYGVAKDISALFCK